MASGLYTAFKAALLTQNPSIDFDADTIKARIYSTSDYTQNLGTNDFIDDVTAYSGTTDQTLSNKTTTAGVFDNTADLTFSSVAIDGAKLVHGVVIYKDTGTASTSPVICDLLFATARTPNGGDITVAFSGSGLFSL